MTAEPNERAPDCLDASEIAALAASDDAPPETRAHLAACAACRDRLAAAQEEYGYLERVRALTASGLGPADAPRVPGYRITDTISAGTQGIVYRAVQESTQRAVAIKTVKSGAAPSARQQWRLTREAEIASRLRHPGIVTIYESVALGDGRTAIVMELVDGAPLDAWRPATGSTSEDRQRVIEVITQLCRAVHHAHLNGVIHRDLKPDNVLVGEDGVPIVLDFGIARLGESGRTRTGEFAGTPAYASPEQASGDPHAVDALTDVYAIGVILYRLVCGAYPYVLEGSLLQVARTIMVAPPIAPRAVDPSIPPDLEAVMLRVLAKDRSERYASAAALADDLGRFLAGLPVEARAASGWYLLRKAVALNRRRLVAGAVGALVLSAFLLIALTSMSNARAATEREAQQREAARAERIRVRAVTELLRDVLPAADPEHPEVGAAFSAGLTRLSLRLEGGAFADEPELDQEIRRLWGGVYTGLATGGAAHLVEYAEVALRHGLVRLRAAEPDGVSPEIAAAMHELAGVLLVRGRLDEAYQRAGATIDMRTELFGANDPTTAASVALAARIAEAMGRRSTALAHAGAALSALADETDPIDRLVAASMMTIFVREAIASGDAGRTAEIDRWLRESLRRRFSHLPADAPEVLESLELLADFVDSDATAQLSVVAHAAWSREGGRVTDDMRRDIQALARPPARRATDDRVHPRSDALGRVVRLQESLLGPDHPALVAALLEQMRSAEVEDILSLAADAAVRAADVLEARLGSADLSLLTCLERAATIEIYDGRPARAVELQERACTVWDQTPEAARDELLVANSQRRLAFALDLAGRSEEAVPPYRKALAAFRTQLAPDHYLVALTQSGLALSLLEAGVHGEADALSRAAVETSRDTPIPTDTLAHIQFARGRILASRGQHEEARALLEDAWDDFYGRSGGEAFPWRRTILDELESTCRALGDDAGATTWRRRAAP